MAISGRTLFWAFAYNAALIPLAAGMLWPARGADVADLRGGGDGAVEPLRGR